jgi:tetratricopeptide (TPR) repeat protein
MAGEEWPSALPHITNTSNEKRGPLKVEVSESASADQAIVNSLKKAPEKEVDQQATKAFIAGHYGLSAKLFDMLSGRKPKDPRYFYGSGQSYKMLGDYPTAFACLIMSWHLGNSPFYDTAVSSLIPILQKTVDDTFKVTYGYSANEPEGVLNAGVRMWKAGMTAQSIKLFEYVLKTDPLYRGAAAYDLGAVAEHDNNPKLALEYYKWALKENNHLIAAAEKSPELSGAINKSLSLIPPGYIESATADLQQRVLRGDVSWNGWTQGVIHPEHWCSEVCPLCAISRTSLKYLGGQMTLK